MWLPKTNPCLAPALAALLIIRMIRPAGLSADDHADYRYGYYQEEGGRITVNTQSALFEQALTPWLALKGQMTFDAISGATPTGAPPPSQVPFFALLGIPANSLPNTVPTLHMRDQRWAGSMDAEMAFGRSRITPEFSYSSEHDYISRGAALNYSLDANSKNTSLNLGWSHDWDRILPNGATYISQTQGKDTDSVLIGVNQLLGPETVLTASLTFRNSSGYQADPYRGVLFDAYPQFDPTSIILFPESRPGHRETFLGYGSLTRFVTPLNGSVEATARLSHDSFDINAYTLGLAWRQKIGRRVMLSPEFRYYRQTAASFYATHFGGDPTDPTNPAPIPTYYSSDYRLSRMETFTFGATLSVRAADWLTLDASYQRYQMRGLDGVTSQSAYPQANIVTAGVRVWW